MARRLADKNLDTRTARRKLAPRAKPYWRSVEKGLHLGYRRLEGAAGPWIARHYAGDQRYKEEGIGIADDLSDADGVAIFTYWQAIDRARARMKTRVLSDAGVPSGPYTVADAVADHLKYLEHEKKTSAEARYRAEAHILPALGKIELNKLTAKKIEDWRNALARQPARLRTRSGEKQQVRDLDHSDDEAMRRRRATANRCLAQLKAALNRAWHNGKVADRNAWQRVKPFKGVGAARERYLTVAEATRLLNACDPDFRLLCRAALETGARHGELVRLRVSDFNADTGMLLIRTSKSNKPRDVVLTDEGQEFFAQVCAGRSADEITFRKDNGSPWGASSQQFPMMKACQRAKITPAVGFHQLRHTWASLAVMNGTPLFVVAKNLGHRDTKMVELHYGHLAQSYVVDAIRAGAPRFGFPQGPQGNVRVIR
jgi:integrase